MEKVRRKIKVSDGYVIYAKDKGYAGDVIEASYAVVDEENKDVKKIISFNMWDDFSFSAWGSGEESIDFTIDKENPLYNPLKKFLNKDGSILIDDDDTLEEKVKTMEISKEKDDVKIIFTNKNLGKTQFFHDRYKVFIKNIMHDGRSKLDRAFDEKLYEIAKRDNIDVVELYRSGKADEFDVKKRLIGLFNDFEKALTSIEKDIETR